MRNIAANGMFTRADVDDVWVGRGKGNCTNRRHIEVAIGDVAPGLTSVGSLPYATRARTKVKRVRLGGVTAHRHHPPTPMWANQTPFE